MPRIFVSMSLGLRALGICCTCTVPSTILSSNVSCSLVDCCSLCDDDG